MDTPFIKLGLACVDVAMGALAWLILICTYPDFARWRPEDFARQHEAYTHRVGWVVGPLLGAQMAGHAWVASQGGGVIGLGLVGLCWALTACWSMPAHRQLQRAGPASIALATLIHSHAWRTATWTILAAYSFWQAAG